MAQVVEQNVGGIDRGAGRQILSSMDRWFSLFFSTQTWQQREYGCAEEDKTKVRIRKAREQKGTIPRSSPWPQTLNKRWNEREKKGGDKNLKSSRFTLKRD